MSKLAAVVVVIGVIAVGVGVAMYLNYLPNPLVSNVAAQYPSSTMMLADTGWLASIGADAETVDLLAELNIHVYGINGDAASSIVFWYEDRNARDGWSVVPEASVEDSGVGWHSYLRGWQKGLMGQLIWIGEGTKVKTYSGYDVVIITSSAPISTYERLLE